MAKSIIFLAAEQILRRRHAFLQLQICGLHTIQSGNLNLFIIAFVGGFALSSLLIFIS